LDNCHHVSIIQYVLLISWVSTILRHQPRPSALDDPKVHIIHRAEAAVHFLHIPGSQIHILARHLERGMPQDLLQAEDVPAVHQKPHSEHLQAFMVPL
jgi:hypothetical protein